MSASLLQPVLFLVLWSLIVLFWMVAKRMPAMMKATIPKEDMVGGRGQDLDRILPKRINWPAHNYAHLVEQPTLFYATTLALAVVGHATSLTVSLAWAYVALRIIHSLWQILVNTIPVRASLFFLSTLVLVALAVNGAIAVFSAG